MRDTDTALQVPHRLTNKKLRENKDVLFAKTGEKMHCFQVLCTEQ